MDGVANGVKVWVLAARIGPQGSSSSTPAFCIFANEPYLSHAVSVAAKWLVGLGLPESEARLTVGIRFSMHLNV